MYKELLGSNIEQTVIFFGATDDICFSLIYFDSLTVFPSLFTATSNTATKNRKVVKIGMKN